MNPLVLLAAEGGPILGSVAESAPGDPIDLAWLIPVIPAVSAGLLLLFGGRLGRLAAWVAILAVGASATISTAVFTQLLASEERTFVTPVARWLDIAGFTVDWSLLVDPLSGVLILLVTWVGLLIHIYSLGYMEGDPRYARFFAYLNLFVASMLILVLGDSLLVLFVGWELVGLCSYLLIGFWFERRDYASAAKKAFLVNRVGDVGFMIAMFVVYSAVGSLAFADVLPAAGEIGTATLVAVGLLLLLAATGKSAQIPLYVWLPDAMAGPTPVSALIHAATMVTAGVYLIARTSPIYAEIPDVGLLVAGIGALTALVTAIIACAQVDLKRILAYSTVSQLGYMFIGVGVGDHTAGVFHLLTHGFFKALLFLAAGSVMHALADQTDIRRMGGLARVMPITAGTSALAVLAIAGIWPLSGFYSKEEILASAAQYGPAAGTALWAVGLFTAGLTAFYMTRWFVLVFLGPARWRETSHPATAAPQGAAPAVHGEPAHHEVHPHESPIAMTLPLVVLVVGTVAGGLININPETGFLHGWLVGTSVVPYEREASVIPEGLFLPLALAAGVLGIALAAVMYLRIDARTIGVGGGARLAARRAFYVDELNDLLYVRLGGGLSRFFAWFDATVVDGAVNGLGRLTTGLATVGRRIQTGFVRSYALAVLTGAVLVTAILLGTALGVGIN
jgi:NADH-quinone oxidoreductase subunit L